MLIFFFFFFFLHAYVSASQDVKVLQNTATKLAPQIDTMIDAVRSQLPSHFSIDEDMKLGNESLRRYLGRIMTGPYDNR